MFILPMGRMNEWINDKRHPRTRMLLIYVEREKTIPYMLSYIQLKSIRGAVATGTAAVLIARRYCSRNIYI